MMSHLISCFCTMWPAISVVRRTLPRCVYAWRTSCEPSNACMCLPALHPTIFSQEFSFYSFLELTTNTVRFMEVDRDRELCILDTCGVEIN
jgi:hypothetical protein